MSIFTIVPSNCTNKHTNVTKFIIELRNTNGSNKVSDAFRILKTEDIYARYCMNN